ncbi:MAG: hypothetical protein HFJ52_08015 [Clostridia bacterium]|nr:hypothetical protein [Clostridia bacterium]
MAKTITLEELTQNKENKEYIKANIIKIEDIFEKNKTIKLKEQELQQFLNGVKLSIKTENGIYKIQNEKGEFIGIGEVKESRLKRDIIIK